MRTFSIFCKYSLRDSLCSALVWVSTVNWIRICSMWCGKCLITQNKPKKPRHWCLNMSCMSLLCRAASYSSAGTEFELFIIYWFTYQGQCTLINIAVNVPELAKKPFFSPWTILNGSAERKHGNQMQQTEPVIWRHYCMWGCVQIQLLDFWTGWHSICLPGVKRVNLPHACVLMMQFSLVKVFNNRQIPRREKSHFLGPQISREPTIVFMRTRVSVVVPHLLEWLRRTNEGRL